jgi:hypothetical protein
MNANYRYNPKEFEGILGLSNELTAFYHLHQAYANKKTNQNRFALKKQWEDLFFTIKHREIEGALNSVAAQEMRWYLEELASD